MNLQYVKTWTVTADHKARPKNPYDNWNEPDYRKESLVSFETFATQHVYHTDETLKPGEYPAESVKLQRLCMYSWNQPNYKPVSEEWYQDMKDASENKFKSQIELLIDVEVLQNDQWVFIRATQSEINEWKETNKWFKIREYPQLNTARNQPEVKQQGGEWISVEDRLPEIGVNVIIHCIDRDFENDPEVVIGWVYRIMDNIPWWQSIHANEDEDLTITHWMPLPKPPKV